MRDAYCETEVAAAVPTILSLWQRLYRMSSLAKPSCRLETAYAWYQSNVSYLLINRNKTSLIMQSWEKAHNHMFSLTVFKQSAWMEWWALLDAQFIVSVVESRRDYWILALWVGWFYYTVAPVLGHQCFLMVHVNRVFKNYLLLFVFSNSQLTKMGYNSNVIYAEFGIFMYMCISIK